MARAFEKIRAQNALGRYLCVGLDPDPDYLAKLYGYPNGDALTPGAYYRWMKEVIRGTAPFAAAYKPNLGFWVDNFEILRKAVALITETVPLAAIILDAKNGDISSTQAGWARSAKRLGVHGVTVNPYMGTNDVTEQFLSRDMDCFVLAQTSNKGASEFQLKTLGDSSLTLSETVAITANALTLKGLGVVVGATDVDGLRKLRKLAPAAPFLIPGVGAQGGDLEAVVAEMREHKAPWLVNIGRGITNVEAKHPEAWSKAIQDAAHHYADAMRPVSA